MRPRLSQPLSSSRAVGGRARRERLHGFFRRRRRFRMTFDWDFFIAHAGGDIEPAEALYEHLNGPVARVFLDKKNLLLGDNWDAKIAQAQRASLITLVLISGKTDRAYYEREEIAAAIALARENENRHRVIPVFL